MRRRFGRLGGPDLLVALIGAVGFAAVALARGRDANWDLQNYHLYDALSLLDGRGARDVAPAGPQTFLDPLPYLLPVLLDRAFGARAGAALLAIAQSAVVPLAWRIAIGIEPARLRAAVATLAGVTASLVLAEIGTSFEELLLAILPLASLALLVASPRHRPLAGLATGIAVGLKLALAPLAAALMVAAVATEATGTRLRALCGLGVGLAAGWLLGGGVWAAILLARFGNPFFPFLNNLFRSPDAAPIEFRDEHAYFHGLVPALLRPWRAAIWGIPVPLDVPFRDPRQAVGLVLVAAWLAVRRRRAPCRGLDLLAAWLLVAEAAWLVLAPVERYALALDLVFGLFAILAFGRIWPHPPRAALAGLAALLVLDTRVTDFFHRPFAPAWHDRPPAIVGRDYDLVLLGAPLGAWAVADPAPRHAFGLTADLMVPGGVLTARLSRGLAAAGDRLWAVGFDRGIGRPVRTLMGREGLVLSPPCARTASMYWPDAVFCRAHLVAGRALGAATLAPGAIARFGRTGAGWIYEGDGWDPADEGSVRASAGAELIFDPGTNAVLVAELDVLDPTGAARTLRLCTGSARPRTLPIEAGTRLAWLVLRPPQTGECGG